MPTPTVNPIHRQPGDVSPTDRYRPTDPVWVHRGSTWCAGVVETASPRAATVTYRPAGSRGTGLTPSPPVTSSPALIRTPCSTRQPDRPTAVGPATSTDRVLQAAPGRLILIKRVLERRRRPDRLGR